MKQYHFFLSGAEGTHLEDQVKVKNISIETAGVTQPISVLVVAHLYVQPSTSNIPRDSTQ